MINCLTVCASTQKLQLTVGGKNAFQPAKMATMDSSNAAQILKSMEGFTVGIIGMGDMGKMYARRLSTAGWR